MYRHVEELVNAIKDEDVYKKYKVDESLLANFDTKQLLVQYQNKLQDYNELQKYSSYISLDELKEELKQIKIKMSQDANINQYYESYYALNDLLEEVTTVVYKEIDDTLIQQRWTLK